MNRRDLAVASPLFGGAVTAFLLPFRNTNVTVRERQLDSLDPHYRYTHQSTREERTVEPAEHALAAAQKLESPWAVTDLWSTTHSNFVMIDPTIIDLEFAPFDAATLPDVRALALYWQTAPQDTAGRWEAWRTLVSIDVSNALVEAYQNIRINAYSAAKALAAPAEGSAGES